MRRRAFIALLSGAAVGFPAFARAQQSPLPLVGVLNSAAAGPFARMFEAFRQSLADAGYVDGRNVRIDVRWADGQYERLPQIAADLVRGGVDVLAAPGGDVAALAAKSATSTIPIVFMVGADPVRSGLVRSLNRPGGNATGINIFTSVLAAKRLELLREIVSQGGLIGVLVNPDNSNAESDIADLQAAGRTLDQVLHVEKARTAEEIDHAFSGFAARKAVALLVNTDPFYLGRRDQLAALSLQHKLPAIYSLREHAAAGGLISYGSNLIDSYRQIGEFVGRVLKGGKVAEMPVEQPTKFEMVINLRTAKALGLTITPTMLARSDEVIE